MFALDLRVFLENIKEFIKSLKVFFFLCKCVYKLRNSSLFSCVCSVHSHYYYFVSLVLFFPTLQLSLNAAAKLTGNNSVAARA